MSTAGALIIGDEILAGHVQDVNGPLLAGRLRDRGVALRQLSWLPDLIAVIAEEVSRLSPQVDWLITSGGVGPTHDDVSFAGIARAFELPLVRHPQLVEVLQRRLRSPINEAALHMAEVPEGARFWWDGHIAYPVVVVHNVIVLPGMPSLFSSKLDAVLHRLGGSVLLRVELVTRQRETVFAEQLRRAALAHPAVHIGSYPGRDAQGNRVVVALESQDDAELAACRALLERELQLAAPDGES